MNALKRNIILASKSPRRSQLLEAAGFNFTVKVKEVEEIYPDSLPPREVAEYLAKLKADASREFLITDEIILTADSIVLLNNTIFGKPKDAADAFHIIRTLSGKMHEVITGVCLLSKTKEVSFSAISKVYFEALSDEEIHYYVDNFKPFDKAGAYAIQEWIGLCKISKIEGAYSNIMGLPVERVYREMEQF